MKNSILKNGWFVRVVLLAALLIINTIALSEPAEKVNTSTTGSAIKEEKTAGEITITADWKDNPLRQVLQYIAERAGVNIIPDLSITDEVRVQAPPFNNLPWHRTLEEVCLLSGCILEEVTPSFFRVNKPPTISLKGQGAKLDKLIEEIAGITGLSIIIADDVKGMVIGYYSFNNVPWMDALDYLAKTAGVTVVKEERNVIRIVRPQTIAAQMETRVFQLKYLRPPVDYKAKISVNYAVGEPKAPKGVEDFTLLTILKGMLSPASGINPAGSLQYDLKTNSLIVRDTKPVLDEIQKLTDKLDIEPMQIMFNVHFINTTNTDLLDFGINYAWGTDGGWKVTSTPSSDPATRRTRSPFGMGAEYPSGTGFDMAFLTQYDVAATLRLFKSDATSKLEQRPSILTLDGQEATIVVNERIHYAQTTASSSSTGTLTYSIAEATGSPVDPGFQLLVVPNIVKGTNKVMLTVIPQDKFMTGTTSPLTGFERFSVATGTGVGASTQSIDLPRYRQSTLITHLIIESGQTAVIGGLSTDRYQHTLKRIPFFSDIPILGGLFRSTEDNVTKNHLLIFITPTIVHKAQDSIEVLKERIKTLEEEGKDVEDNIKEKKKEKEKGK